MRVVPIVVLGSLLIFLLSVTSTHAASPSLIDRCATQEAYYIPDGRDYRGTVNTTANGIPCQPWAAQYPHSHNVMVPTPSAGIMDDNYCRNPFAGPTAGCFTMDPDVVWQYCSIGAVRPVKRIQPYIAFNTGGFPIAAADAGSAVSIPVGTFVSVFCYPQPCRLYYSLDGSTPDIRNPAMAYQHALRMDASATLSAVGVLLDGTILQNQTFFTVIQPPPLSLYFTPDPSLAYVNPILVSLQQIPSGASVTIFLGSNPVGVPYTGTPFWLASATVVTAVINSNQKLSAVFNVQCQTPVAPSFFPQGGNSFIGQVRVLIYQPSTSVHLEVSINGSAWTAVAGPPLYTITTIGQTSFATRAIYLGGLVSAVSGPALFTVFPAVDPTCFPRGNQTFYTAINVTCSDPSGEPLTLAVNGAPIPSTSFPIASPGTATVNASYLDDGGVLHFIIVWYQVLPQVLPPPQVFPCSGTYLGPVTVGVTLPLMPTQQWALNATSPLQALYPNSTSVVGTGFSLAVSGSFFVTIASADPLFLNSITIQCTLNVVTAQDTFSTAPVRVLGSSSPTAFTQSLTTCLLLVSPAPFISISANYGMYNLVQIQNISLNFVQTYSDRLWKCLPPSSAAAAAPYVIALSYTILEAPSQVVVGSTVHLNVLGTMLAPTSSLAGNSSNLPRFIIVRDEFTCDDIGISVQSSALTGGAGVQLTFTTSFVGTYALCTDCGNGFYKVQSATPIVFTAAALSSSNLVSPCGGLYKYPVAVASLSQGASLVYSSNGLPWVPMGSSFVVSSPMTLVVSRASGSGAILASQQQTCVFYFPTISALFSGYDFALASAASPPKLRLKGSAPVDTNAVVQVQKSVYCNDTAPPVLSSYITSNGQPASWETDAVVALPRPSSDITQLTVCLFIDAVFSAVIPPAGPVVLSALALSTTPCAQSPLTGCFQGTPTCVDSNRFLTLCSYAAPTPDMSVSFTSDTLKLLMLGVYVVVVIGACFCWRHTGVTLRPEDDGVSEHTAKHLK